MRLIATSFVLSLCVAEVCHADAPVRYPEVFTAYVNSGSYIGPVVWRWADGLGSAGGYGLVCGGVTYSMLRNVGSDLWSGTDSNGDSCTVDWSADMLSVGFSLGSAAFQPQSLDMAWDWLPSRQAYAMGGGYGVGMVFWFVASHASLWWQTLRQLF